MQKEKLRQNQKGITLIALIITIIVMLILVGVSVTVALKGGLFSSAQDATARTETERDKELALDSKRVKVNEKWYDSMEDYIAGRESENQNDIIENTPENSLLPQGLEVGSEFEMDADEDGTPETWVVLYDETASHLNENEIEVISKDVMGEPFYLGKNDTEAMEKATDIDEDGTVESIEIAIYSYNNAIDRLNNCCNDLIKIDNLGVRSVGSLPSNPSYKNTSKPYAIQNLDKWTENGKATWNTYGVLGEDKDTNKDSDDSVMNTLGITNSVSNTYWLASRNVYEAWSDSSNNNGVYFGLVYRSPMGGGTRDCYLIKSSGSIEFPSPQLPCCARPVVKLQYP